MKFLKNKNKSTNNSTSVGGNGNGSGTTRPMEPDLKTRRIITATIPPTGTSANESSNTTMTADDSLLDNDDHGHDRSPPLLGTSAQKTEVLQEKSEIWRKERLDATAKLRKEHKEKELMEHRMRQGSGSASSTSIGGDKENENASGGTGTGTGAGAERAKFDIPATLSVENKNPEHKRKSQSVNDETGKKLRSDSEVDREASNENGGNFQASERRAGAEAKTWRSKAAQMMKASGPGVLVAVVAMVAVRFLRK